MNRRKLTDGFAWRYYDWNYCPVATGCVEVGEIKSILFDLPHCEPALVTNTALELKDENQIACKENDIHSLLTPWYWEFKEDSPLVSARNIDIEVCECLAENAYLLLPRFYLGCVSCWEAIVSIGGSQLTQNGVFRFIQKLDERAAIVRWHIYDPLE